MVMTLRSVRINTRASTNCPGQSVLWRLLKIAFSFRVPVADVIWLSISCSVPSSSALPPLRAAEVTLTGPAASA